MSSVGSGSDEGALVLGLRGGIFSTAASKWRTDVGGLYN